MKSLPSCSTARAPYIHAVADFLGCEITFFFVCRDLVLAAIFAFAGALRFLVFYHARDGKLLLESFLALVLKRGLF